jgi:hypothetical protein
LEAVSLRFEHILRGDEETACSWGLHMYTLELPFPNPNRKQLININYCKRNSSKFYFILKILRLIWLKWAQS